MATPTGRADAVDAALAQARRAWAEALDVRALRRALLDLVRRLAEE